MKTPLKSIFPVRTALGVFLLFSILVAYPNDNTDYYNYYSGLLSKKLYSNLLINGEIEHAFTQKTTLYLLPRIYNRTEIIKKYETTLPDMGVEILKLYKTRGKINFSSKKSKLLIYNIIHSISSLKGIKYYSHTHKKIRTLFYDAYVINSPDKPTKIKDPVLKKLHKYDKIYILQNDSTFGKNIFLVEYITDKHFLSIRIENLTTMKYLFIPLIPPHNMVTYMVIIPGSNSIIFYGLSFSNYINILPVAKENVVSFYNRLIAMYNWFIGEINKHQKEFSAY